VWAKVEDRSGSESYQADQLTATRNTVFTIRWIAGLGEKMRILYNYDYYDIQAIKSPDRKRTLQVESIKLDDPEEQDPDLVGEGIFDLSFDATFE
jgi:SPP1 family predicted phage head-tail adaptor